MNHSESNLPPYPLEGVVEDLLKSAPQAAPTGLTRDYYLDLAEPFVRLAAQHQADSGAIIDPYWEGGESPTATARFVGAAAVLIGAGRCTELVECAAKSMDCRCQAVHRSHVTGQRLPAFDFETRDLMLGLRFLTPHVDAAQGAPRSSQWRRRLGAFDPEAVYVDVLAQHSAERIYNWNVYALCGEWLKYTDGVADNRKWIDTYVPLQLPRFNEVGLYRDPSCPFTYDLTVRQGFSWMFANGYSGARSEEVDELLRRGALTMLLYLSPLGQAPYGGRSNQFHHNEAMAACVCEFEATRYAKQGDAVLAGAFRRQARLCAQATAPWLLGADPPRHLKNRYHPETMRGCDSYGHYSVYGLLASNLFGVAYLMADDTERIAECARARQGAMRIAESVDRSQAALGRTGSDIAVQEHATPAEVGGTLLCLPDEDSSLGGFHKVFASCRGYHVEIDTNGQPGQDATGLGRLHRLGVPSWVGLSSPAAAAPAYIIGADSQDKGAAACVAWLDEKGEWHCLAELPGDGFRTDLRAQSVSRETVSFAMVHEIESGPVLTEQLELSEDGLTVSVRSDSKRARIGYCVPMPVFDGEYHAEIEATPTSVCVRRDEGTFFVECLDGESGVVLTDRLVENRNGALALYRIEGPAYGIQLRLGLVPSERPERSGAEE